MLGEMVADGYITADQQAEAKKTKLKFINGGMESSPAPYFVDMVKDHLLERLSENDLETQSYRIYTTLDPDLQRAASEAVQIGVKNLDKLLARRYAIWKKKGQAVPPAQVAVVVMDPHTGEIGRRLAGAIMARASSTTRRRGGNRDRSSSHLFTRRLSTMRSKALIP